MSVVGHGPSPFQEPLNRKMVMLVGTGSRKFSDRRLRESQETQICASVGPGGGGAAPGLVAPLGQDRPVGSDSPRCLLPGDSTGL